MKKIFKKKKILLALLSVVLVAVMAFAGTYAWFVSTDRFKVDYIGEQEVVKAAWFTLNLTPGTPSVEVKELDLVAVEDIAFYDLEEDDYDNLVEQIKDTPPSLLNDVNVWEYSIADVIDDLYLTIYPGEGVGLILDLANYEFEIDANRTVVVKVSMDDTILASITDNTNINDIDNTADIYWYNSLRSSTFKSTDEDGDESLVTWITGKIEGEFYAIVETGDVPLTIGELFGGSIEVGFGIIGISPKQNEYMNLENIWDDGVELNIGAVDAEINITVVQATPAAVLDTFDGDVEIEWTAGAWAFKTTP